jgi:hypothetical protein
MGEEEKEVKVATGEPVLPCGHTDCFEHRTVQGLFKVIEICQASNIDPTTPCMDYLTKVMEALYIPIPSMEEIRKIALSRAQESKEVH